MESTTALDQSSPRILVIDDSRDKRSAIKTYLKFNRRNYVVTEADGGILGMVKARQETPDLILLDIQMDDKNGYECLAELKENPVLRQIPVLIISGHDSKEGNVVQCIKLGADDFFKFPVEEQLPVFLARIDSALQRRRQQKAQEALQRDLEATLIRLNAESERAEMLLEAIFPRPAIEELKLSNEIRPKRFEHVAVLFCDVVGFTAFCDNHAPEDVIPPLEMLTEQFEAVVERFGLEKIKMIGDALMAVSGLFPDEPDYVLKSVQCGFAMIEAAQQLPAKWNLRVGIHVGPVVAGKLGRKKYMYDVWGDTVNTASRIESAGIPGTVVVSQTAWTRIAHACQGTSLGLVELKNKPALELFRIDRVIKPVA